MTGPIHTVDEPPKPKEQSTTFPLSGTSGETAASPEVVSDQLQDKTQSDGCSTTQNAQAALLVKFVMERFKLFHNSNKVVFCQDIDSGKVFELDSRSFRDRTQAGFYKTYGHTPREQSVREALRTLTGLGRFDNPCLSVELRAAGGNGNYYLDLAIPGNSQSIQLQPGCWRIIDSTETMFFRPDSMRQLPTPVPGGNIERLCKY